MLGHFCIEWKEKKTMKRVDMKNIMTEKLLSNGRFLKFAMGDSTCKPFPLHNNSIEVQRYLYLIKWKAIGMVVSYHRSFA